MYGVLRRLDGAGLLPAGSDVARRAIPQEEVAALLGFAAQADTGTATAYLYRFREDFAPPRPKGITRLDASLLISYRVQENQVAAGKGDNIVWSGARPIDDDTDAGASTRVGVAAGMFAGAIGVENSKVHELQAVIASNTLGVGGGRRQLGYATAHGGGIVLDDHRFDALGLWLTRPLNLPVLGRTRFEMHLSKIDNLLLRSDPAIQNDTFSTRPWFWTARGSVQPHARLRIGVTRGMMFGGEGNLPVTFERVFNNLIGNYARADENEFANQSISFDFRYRAPTGAVPVTAYLDWGSEDASGAWFRMPAIIGGIEVSLLRQADLLLGVERAEFAEERVNRSSYWYRNAWFRGSWADDGDVLGHDLGGHGVEWRAFMSGGSAMKGITFDAAAFKRERGAQNVFAPQRQGGSVGGALKLTARVNSSLQLVLSGDIEHGMESDDWTSTKGRAGVRLRF